MNKELLKGYYLVTGRVWGTGFVMRFQHEEDARSYKSAIQNNGGFAIINRSHVNA